MKTLLTLTIFTLAACDLAGTDQIDERELRLSSAGSTATTSGEAPVAYSFTDGALFRQNFESVPFGSGTWYTSSDPNNQPSVTAYTTGGINGRILTVKYIKRDGPNEGGTERVTKEFLLPSTVTSATLSFDVKFHSAFEFVIGGKLPGLGAEETPTGCTDDPDHLDGWTVRPMWRDVDTIDGVNIPEVYVYDQDRPPGECGDERDLPDESFVFQTGTWYRVDLQVQMNSAVDVHDGLTELWVEGAKVARKANLSLKETAATGVDRFLFNTFHGGNDSAWTPMQEEMYAYFDNFTVRPGLSVSGTKGTACEITEEGIYNVGAKVCCAEGCGDEDSGGCGGSGCASNPGGAANCCTGTILASGRVCTQSGISAPCYYP